MIEATKRYFRLAAGWGLVTAGLILIPLPGPGLPLILAGLTALSRESAWARGMMERLRNSLRLRRQEGTRCERKSSSLPASWP